MKARLIRIGNSRGVRLPKGVIEAGKLGDEVELAVQADGVLIRSTRRPRQGWESEFSRMHAAGDDNLLDPASSLSRWDEQEWEW